MLIYHRVGGDSKDERDVSMAAFSDQLRAVGDYDVVSLDAAVGRIKRGDDSASVVLTFDDGFSDVYENAWPLLRARRLPFFVYLATAFVGAETWWPGSTAKSAARGLAWAELAEMVDSGLCTVGNHTHTHARPELLTTDELDLCSDAIERYLGVRPRHFAYPWGVVVSQMAGKVSDRFDTAATADLGRNLPGDDLQQLRRIPVRRSDPVEFFRAKLTGSLWPERIYASMVWAAKRLGTRA